MIKYNSGSFGFALLFRLHGSAVCKSLTPAILSSGLYLVLLYTTDLTDDEEQILLHPYAMGALIAALTFLLAFRANFAYNRYWEAFSAVHQMHSKWMDVGMDIAAFHLQSSKYDGRRPPAFGEHPTLTCLERERERNEPTMSDLEERIDDILAANNNNNPDYDGGPSGPLDKPAMSLRHKFQSALRSRRASKRSNRQSKRALGDDIDNTISNRPAVRFQMSSHKNHHSSHDTLPTGKPLQASPPPMPTATGPPATRGFSGGAFGAFFGNIFTVRVPKAFRSPSLSEESLARTDPSKPVLIKTMSSNNFPKAWEDNQPPLLLQEGAHLLSLLSAVALSTLRNDLEEADSPLITFTPGAPWPHVDPDAYGADVRKGWTNTHRSWTIFSYLMGTSRNAAARTLYNAARPFRVIGGVSDAEIEVLQAARGPYAKVALCTMWVEEFICREHLNGGTGAVGAPIISRLFQFTSDGMIGYNQARKVSYIPFPFPHAQITSLFVLMVVGLMPVLVLSFVNDEVFGFIINLLTVMCFTGLHEVARELENPFQNVPNDIPLNNFQAQFNEGLMQMFAGYHPDAFWEIKQVEDEDETSQASSFPPSEERLENMKKEEQTEANSKDIDDDPSIRQVEPETVQSEIMQVGPETVQSETDSKEVFYDPVVET